MPELETLRSFVNTWECDENDHLNVQFYFDRFDTADQHYRLIAGIGADALGARKVRHLRFHSELHAATPLTVHSRAARGGPHPASVVHAMRRSGDGTLAATALDGYDRGLGVLAVDAGEVDEVSMPRGLEGPAADLAEPPGGRVTYRGLVWPSDCGADGTLSDRGYVSCFTDGAAHTWDMAGLTAEWLNTHGLGRVAVEMKLTYGVAPVAGDLLVQKSKLAFVRGRTFGLHHCLIRANTGEVAAIGDVVALVMDLSERRAVELPAEVAERVAATIGT